jgi:hypothetical protein
MWGVTFGLFRGVFILSPLLLLALPGFVLWWRSSRYRAQLVVIILSSLTMFLFNASSVMWWGGFSIGPRYLLPALPFFVLPMLLTLQYWWPTGWFKAVVILLFLWSFITTWGLTLAEQAFPPDGIRNPLLEYAWPNWQVGNIARNVGTLRGLSGSWCLLPLAVLAGLVILTTALINKNDRSTFPANPVDQPEPRAASQVSTRHI